MSGEGDGWIMRGLDWDDPGCVQSWEELTDLIDQLGFLPLFRNAVDGFSVEEHTASLGWWCGDAAQDPWEWRRFLARSGRVAYGKFFGKKAGFILVIQDGQQWRHLRLHDACSATSLRATRFLQGRLRTTCGWSNRKQQTKKSGRLWRQRAPGSLLKNWKKE